MKSFTEHIIVFSSQPSVNKHSQSYFFDVVNIKAFYNICFVSCEKKLFHWHAFQVTILLDVFNVFE